jgi:hypothetical protein
MFKEVREVSLVEIAADVVQNPHFGAIIQA